MHRIIVPALAAFSIALVAVPAAAEKMSIEVQYSDLNLDNPAGMATLEGRIQAAARKICGKTEVRKVHDGDDHQSCMRQTQASVSVELARLIGPRPLLALNTRR